jgi:hypothetical protein
MHGPVGLAIGLLVAATAFTACRESAAPGDAPRTEPAAAGDRYPVLIPGGEEADAGHVRFRLVGARLDRHENGADGAPKTLALRVQLRATEIASQDTHMTGDHVRLLAAGRSYPPQGTPYVSLWASQSVDLDEIVFVVPAPLATASLQLGTADGGSALLALRLPR